MPPLLTPSQRILIISSQTGGGHVSAAAALQESFLRLSPGQVLVNIAHVLEEANFLTRHLAELYNYLLRYHQHYMRYYYWAIQKIKPYESHMLFECCLKYGSQLLEKIAPTTLVSVHPMTQHFFAYILRKLRLLDKVPLITVVTDPYAGFWKGWACPEVSQYFVASDAAKAQLVEYGVADQRIEVTGMPVHAKFQPLASPQDKSALRQALDLDPQRFTVLVNAGWVGGGNIPALYQTLLSAPLDNVQVVFLAGKNEALRHQAETLSQQARVPTKVLGFTQDIHQFMNASDVMVSKLGGLTTFEAMACHLPILGDCLTPPMPQEEGTAQFIQNNGAGVLITQPQAVLAELDLLMQNPLAYQKMKQATAHIGRPGAADQIASQILQFPPSQVIH